MPTLLSETTKDTVASDFNARPYGQSNPLLVVGVLVGVVQQVHQDGDHGVVVGLDRGSPSGISVSNRHEPRPSLVWTAWAACL